MFVKPAAGLVIRDPDLLDLLPEAGREVPNSGYWQRRLRDGDVAEADPAKPLDQKPATSPVPEAPSKALITNATDKGVA